MKYEYSKREQGIDKEAINYAESILSQERIIDGDDLTSSFWKGVRFADSHPNWYKYPEDKPQIEDQYAIFTTDKAYIIADYRNGHFVIDIFGIYEELEDQDVVAWMEKPRPPKFD